MKLNNLIDFLRKMSTCLLLKLQIRKSFEPFRWDGDDYDFDEWNSYAMVDGWLCRNDLDCSWIDLSLGCNDREFVLNEVTVRNQYCLISHIFCYNKTHKIRIKVSLT